ncbi:MAG TPA: FAD-dependent oxidoreductase [Acidobacteriota bacterium]|nr:FAD-dependent oxidoreductase [Acidobacteriota bacterium]HMZ81859.1 FAD-dependent oxidoreductase [Acidobacteriota bacterium]HNB73103.1 FAD-dependent oxidoreductase [Acidobacteriota bacterium]HNG93056.1 FAD-dependent oxidoreductase [Acidobacteriota bacterium]HNH82962.1 FAD-dependent oxidoreductase [Acidobacteriota bacterium]
MSSKKRLVILGTGFAAVSLVKKINLRAYEVTIVSPRNHFLFTPLLPSTTVGTIEFRSIIEPIRKVRRGVKFLQGACTRVDEKNRTIHCKSIDDQVEFTVEYDQLVISVGAENNTFNIPGVREHALFLKELTDARNIRERIVACLERASVPGISKKERDKLLHFVVVGGGPTGVEFAAELHDLLDDDLKKSYPELVNQVRITLFEAGKSVLNSFDVTLGDYTKKHFNRQGIEVRLETPVAQVGTDFLKLKTGEVIPTGLIVWSTGYGPTSFIKSLPFEKDRSGRIFTNEFLQIAAEPTIYAMGDCATITGIQLPQTAQLAMQQGKYLAEALNKVARDKQPKPFKFVNLGMLAYIGESQALAEIPMAGVRGSGMTTFLFWRSAYLTRLVSLKNKVLVLFDWFKTFIFGRDLSKF